MIDWQKQKELIARRAALEAQFWFDNVYVEQAWDDLIAEFYEHGFESGAALAEKHRDYFGSIVAVRE